MFDLDTIKARNAGRATIRRMRPKQERDTEAEDRERAINNARLAKRMLENRAWEDHERALTGPSLRLVAGSEYLNQPKRSEAEARAHITRRMRAK